MVEEQKIIYEHRTIENPPDLKIELTRGQRATYGWTISYFGKNLTEVLQVIKDVDNNLKAEYENSDLDYIRNKGKKT
jgi:hypothetical protein